MEFLILLIGFLNGFCIYEVLVKKNFERGIILSSFALILILIARSI